MLFVLQIAFKCLKKKPLNLDANQSHSLPPNALDMVEGQAIDTDLGKVSWKIHLISLSCSQPPNSSFTVQKSSLKHLRFIFYLHSTHYRPALALALEINCKNKGIDIF